MKKRLLRVLLCLTLAAALLSGTALAGDANGSDSLATDELPLESAQADTPSQAPAEDQAVYTVTFDSDGGSAVESQTVSDGACAQEPEPPTKAGCFFRYWVDETGEEYDFTAAVTADLTLTAAWEGSSSDTYTVTFDVRGGSSVNRQTVSAGSLAQKPADPTKDGSTFQYWEQEDGNEYDFDAPVFSDVNLMAVWEEEAPETSDSTASPDSSASAKSPAPASTATTHTGTGKTESPAVKAASSSARSSSTPDTGDPIHPSLLAGRMALSATGIVVLALLSRRRKTD